MVRAPEVGGALDTEPHQPRPPDGAGTIGRPRLRLAARCAPGRLPGKGPRSRGRTPPTSFPGACPGGPQLCPLTGPRAGRRSGACLCMGGLLLTVCASRRAGGHGSHGPTMYSPPTGCAPQPGGLSQFGIKQQFPRLVAQPGELDLMRSAIRGVGDGHPRGLPYTVARMSSRLLSYQHHDDTTGPALLSTPCGQITGRNCRRLSAAYLVDVTQGGRGHGLV